MNNRAISSLSVFFPCFNDAMTISSLVLIGAKTARELTDDFEIIVVNDGSTDHSSIVLTELQNMFGSQLKIITHAKNSGYGGALRSGFRAASKEWLFYTDGDGQYDVTELKKLALLANNQTDVVQGYKIKRMDPFYRILIGMIYQYAMKFIFKLKIRDVDCDFRLLRTKIFNNVDLKFSTGVICLEMIKKIQDAGFRFTETGVSHYFRIHGKSQFFCVRRLIKVAYGVFSLWLELVLFRTSFKKSKS